MVGLLTARPHTQLWRRLKAESRLPKQNPGGDSVRSADLNFIPKMNTQELLAGGTFWKRSAIPAMRAVAVTGPMPGIATSRRQASFC